MTTLPQTISARPRPAQSVGGLPAVASPALAPVPYTPPTQSGLSGADVWRVVRQNLWIFALVGLLSAVAGYGVNYYLKLHYQRFTADGFIQVQLPKSLDSTGVMRPDAAAQDYDLKTLMKDQAQRLRSDDLLTSLLTRPETVTRQSEWLKSKATVNGSFDLGKALAVLQSSFGAYPGEGSSFIAVSMTAGNPQDARDILMEIVNTHIGRLNEYKQQDVGKKAEQMARYAEERKADLTALENDIRRLGESLGGSDNQNAALLSLNLSNLATELSKANADLLDVTQARDAAADAVAKGTDPAGVAAKVDQDPMVNQYRNTVTSLETELDAMSRTRGTGDQQMKELQRRLDAWRDNVRERENTIRAQTRDQIVSGLGTAVKQAQDKLDGLKAKEARLNEDLNQANVTRSEYEAKRAQLTGKQTAYDNLMLTLRTQKFDAGNRQQEEVTWASRPITPQKPSFPDLKLTMGLCTLLGLGLAVGLAFLREVMDTSVRSPRDIGRVGQMNVLGMIPDAQSDPESGDPLELTIANAPHSMSAEQYRIVRSRLGHVTPLETTRTILVTSPQPGDGKTTVACNLAAGMALNGRKILLVDANFRRPAVHEVFEMPNDTGLADVLADVGRFDELVRETAVPNLYVLPSGTKPANPTELIEGSPFTEFVDAALDEYDHVIFDSGPILFVSETGALAPQCDGVVSVVRARKSSRGLLGRMRDSLRSLNVEHLGVVLNAVRHQAGGYYSRNIKTFYAYQRDGR